MARLFYGLDQLLDGYVDHAAFATGPVLFRHFTELVRGLAGSVYDRHMYEVVRHWGEDDPERCGDFRDFASAWRRQPK